MSDIWLVPLAIGGLGAAALALLAFRLQREVDRLQEALRPLRTTKVRRVGPRSQ